MRLWYTDSNNDVVPCSTKQSRQLTEQFIRVWCDLSPITKDIILLALSVPKVAVLFLSSLHCTRKRRFLFLNWISKVFLYYFSWQHGDITTIIMTTNSTWHSTADHSNQIQVKEQGIRQLKSNPNEIRRCWEAKYLQTVIDYAEESIYETVIKNAEACHPK